MAHRLPVDVLEIVCEFVAHPNLKVLTPLRCLNSSWQDAVANTLAFLFRIHPRESFNMPAIVASAWNVKYIDVTRAELARMVIGCSGYRLLTIDLTDVTANKYAVSNLISGLRFCEDLRSITCRGESFMVSLTLTILSHGAKTLVSLTLNDIGTSLHSGDLRDLVSATPNLTQLTLGSLLFSDADLEYACSHLLRLERIDIAECPKVTQLFPAIEPLRNTLQACIVGELLIPTSDMVQFSQFPNCKTLVLSPKFDWIHTSRVRTPLSFDFLATAAKVEDLVIQSQQQFTSSTLSTVLSSMKRLRRLQLSNCRAVTDFSCISRLESTDLASLNLRFTHLGDNGLRALAVGVPKLTAMDLCGNECHVTELSIIASFSCLETLALREMTISLPEFHKLFVAAEGLASCHSLATLRLRNVSLDHDLDKGFVAVLQSLWRLTALDVSGSHFFDDEAWAFAITAMPRMKSLDASNCPRITRIDPWMDTRKVPRLSPELRSVGIVGTPAGEAPHALTRMASVRPSISVLVVSSRNAEF